MSDNISRIRNEVLTEDEKMELIADYLENGGGGSSKLRVKVKVDYVPTAAAEIRDLSVSGAAGHVYTAMTGVSFEDADGNPVSTEDVTAAIEAGDIEFIGFDHLGDTVTKDGDAVIVQPADFSATLLPVSCIRGNSEWGMSSAVTGQFWAVESSFPFMVGIAQGLLVAVVGVGYVQ